MSSLYESIGAIFNPALNPYFPADDSNVEDAVIIEETSNTDMR